MMKDLSYYRGLPYERDWIARDDESGQYFVVRLRDIPDIYGVGHTREQARSVLTKAFDDQIEWCLEEGLDVPEPTFALGRPIRIVEVVMQPIVPLKDTGTVQLPDADESISSPRASESYGTVEPIRVLDRQAA